MPESRAATPAQAMESFTGTDAELIERYARGPSAMREAVESMDAEQLRSRPIAGKLSSLEVVGHILDADLMMCDRMKRVVGLKRPLLVGVENIRYPEPLHYQERDLSLMLDLFELSRRQMHADLTRLEPAAWQRTGIHTEVGLVTLRDLLAHAVEHLEGHLATIAEKRRALGMD